MALTQTQVSKLYVAIFNRASEGGGNAWWQDNYDDMAVAADAMLSTDDAQEYFGDSLESDQDFIEHIYLNTLNKTVEDDEGGIAFWVDLLGDGATRGEVVAALVDAVESYGPDGDNYDPDDDVTNAAYNQFMNRVAVSDYMAENVENTPENYKQATGFGFDLTVTDDPATVDSAKAIIDELAEDDEPPAPVEPGETFWLTGGKDYNNPDTRKLEGTDKDDVFKAYLDVNLMGNAVNSLNSADMLDGDAGRDQLWANLIQGTSNMMTMPRPIEPNTEKIEELYFNARETVNEAQFVTIAEWIAGGFGAEEFIPQVQLNEVSIAAANMLDVDYIESYHSDANLIVYGLTTEKSTSGTTPLPEMTVSMDHTSGNTGYTQSLLNGDDYDLYKLGDYYNYYVNGQLRASSMKVLFEQNYLVPDVDPGIEGVTFRIMNQDAHDATVGIEGGPLNLDGVYVGRMEFELNGERFDLATYIEEDPNGVGDEFETEAELVDHIQNVALPALIAANPDVPELEDVLITLGGVWRDDDLNRPGREIQLTVPAENTLSVRDAWLQILQAEDPDGTLPAEYGSNRIERVSVIEPEETTEMSINIELEKVGRGEDGGGMIVGGDNYTKGFDTFNVYVKGDSAKPSSLAYLLTTPHNGLKDINIYTHEDYVDAEDGPADLTIGNSNTPVYSILDVNNFDASEFLGTLELYYAAIEASGVYDYKLGATTGDTLSMHVFGDALNTASSGLTIDAGNGDNTVHVDYLNSNGSVGINTNITTGTGDDVVALTNMTTGFSYVNLDQELTNDEGPLPGVVIDNGDAAMIKTGAGDDAIFLNGHDVYCNADTSSYETLNWIGTTAEEWFTSIGLTNIPDWQNGLLNWAPAGDVYPIFNSMVRVTFAGIESDWVEIQSTGYLTEKQQIIDAIALAITEDINLSHLLTVDTDAPDGGMTIDAITGGAFDAGDLSVEIEGPNPALTDHFATTPPSGEYTVGVAQPNDFLLFPGTGDVTDITAAQLMAAWKAYYPGSNVFINADNEVAFGSDSDANVGYFGDPATMTAFLGAVQANAQTLEDLINAGLDVQVDPGAGAESGGVQFVNAGAGHDTIVLPDTGITTVQFTDLFDTTTIVADDEDNIANLRLDFSSYLDSTAASKASSLNPLLDFDDGANVKQGFAPIPVLSTQMFDGIEDAVDWNDIGGGQHNSITYFHFSDLWNGLQGAYAALEDRGEAGEATDILGNDVAIPPASFADFGAEELESALNYWLELGNNIRLAEDYFDDRLDQNLGMDVGSDGDGFNVLGAEFVILVGKDGEVLQTWPQIDQDEDYADPYGAPGDWYVDDAYANGELKVFTGVVGRTFDDDADAYDYHFDNIVEQGVVNLATTDFDWDDLVIGENLFAV